MTDAEIKKALERCKYHSECCYRNSVEECGNKWVLVENTLDLLNRKDAEIERLKNTIEDMCDREITLVERSEKYAKSEAYKDLAEKLKAKKKRALNEEEGFMWCVSVADIEEVLKEVSE